VRALQTAFRDIAARCHCRSRSRIAPPRTQRIVAAWVVALALGMPHAHASEPLATDDATILDKGGCQVEAWHRWSDGGGHVGWLLPACSVTDHLELGAGGARYRDTQVGGHSLYVLQAKAIFHRSADDRFAFGAVAAVQRDGGHAARGRAFHDGVALALVSWNAPEQPLRIHLNAGVVYRRDAHTTGAWGVAAEYDLRDDWTLLAETFRDEPGRAKYQLGVRHVLVTDRVELFASGGDSFATRGSAWFAKFGVRFQTPRLF
jgi:hypothetical protein